MGEELSAIQGNINPHEGNELFSHKAGNVKGFGPPSGKEGDEKADGRIGKVRAPGYNLRRAGTFITSTSGGGKKVALKTKSFPCRNSFTRYKERAILPSDVQ